MNDHQSPVYDEFQFASDSYDPHRELTPAEPQLHANLGSSSGQAIEDLMRTPQQWEGLADDPRSSYLQTHLADQEEGSQHQMDTYTPVDSHAHPSDSIQPLASNLPQTHSNVPTVPVPSRKGRKRARTDTTETPTPIVEYAPDPELHSPQACREFLARRKITDCYLLEIANDDMEDVQTSKHQFIQLIFDALLTPPDQLPRYCPGVRPDQIQKYQGQQKESFEVVKLRMSKINDQRCAQAQAALLYQAALNIHLYGVKENVYNDYTQHAGRASKLLVTNCAVDWIKLSERLGLIAEAIQSNKRVAVDVLNGDEFEDLALNPRRRLKKKGDYLKSNHTRQGNITVSRGVMEAEKARIGAEVNQTPVVGDVTQGKKKRALKKRKLQADPNDEINALGYAPEETNLTSAAQPNRQPHAILFANSHGQPTLEGATSNLQPTYPPPFNNRVANNPAQALPDIQTRYAMVSHPPYLPTASFNHFLVNQGQFSFNHGPFYPGQDVSIHPPHGLPLLAAQRFPVTGGLNTMPTAFRSVLGGLHTMSTDFQSNSGQEFSRDIYRQGGMAGPSQQEHLDKLLNEAVLDQGEQTIPNLFGYDSPSFTPEANNCMD